MASCTFPEAYPGVPLDYDSVVKLFLYAKELGIYNVHGRDEASETLFRMLCRVLANATFCFAADFADNFEGDGNWFDPNEIQA